MTEAVCGIECTGVGVGDGRVGVQVHVGMSTKKPKVIQAGFARSAEPSPQVSALS